MRDYGRVHTAFWTSADIQALSDDGRLLALYLLTSQHSTIAGAYRLPDAYVSDDLGWPSERVSNGLHELIRRGFLTRCDASKWLFLRKFLVWNPPEGPNQWKAVRKIAESIPLTCSFRAEFIEICALLADGKPFPEGNPSGTPSNPLRIQDQDQDQDQEQEQEQERDARERASPAAPLAQQRASKKRKRTEGSKPLNLEAVPGLDLENWQRWADYRTQIRKPIKPASMLAAQRQLAGFGAAQAAVVEHSIAQGYQGLFAPKTNGNGAQPSAAPVRYKTAEEAEDEIIVAALRKGLADSAIVAIEDLACAPNLLARTRAKREELQREQH